MLLNAEAKSFPRAEIVARMREKVKGIGYFNSLNFL